MMINPNIGLFSLKDKGIVKAVLDESKKVVKISEIKEGNFFEFLLFVPFLNGTIALNLQKKLIYLIDSECFKVSIIYEKIEDNFDQNFILKINNFEAPINPEKQYVYLRTKKN